MEKLAESSKYKKPPEDMKIMICLVLCCLLKTTQAQSTPNSLKNRESKPLTIRLYCGPNKAPLHPPLIMVNETPSKYYLMALLNPKDIADISIMNGKDAVKKHGPEAKNGVLYVTLNKKLQLISLTSLFKKFKLNERDWLLPVYAEGKKIINPDEVLTGKNWVKKISVTNQLEEGELRRVITIF